MRGKILALACWLVVLAVSLPPILLTADFFYLGDYTKAQISWASILSSGVAGALFCLARPIRLGPWTCLGVLLGYLTLAPDMTYFPFYLSVGIPISVVLLAHEPELRHLEDLRGIPTPHNCASLGCLGFTFAIAAAIFFGMDSAVSGAINIFAIGMTVQTLLTMPLLAYHLGRGRFVEDVAKTDVPPELPGEDIHDETDWSHA